MSGLNPSGLSVNRTFQDTTHDSIKTDEATILDGSGVAVEQTGEHPDTVTLGGGHEDGNGQIAPETTLIGYETRSGYNTRQNGTTSTEDKTRAVMVGYQAGKNTSFWGTVGVGYRAMTNLTDGFRSTAIGHRAMENTDGKFNTIVGYKGAKDATNVEDSVFIGLESGVKAGSLKRTVAVGRQTAQKADGGNDHVFVGYKSGEVNEGNRNTGVGFSTLRSNGLSDPSNTGDFATALGFGAGKNNRGEGPVLIGYQAGDQNTAARAVAIGWRASVGVDDGGRIAVDQLVFGGTRDTFTDGDLNNGELTMELDETNSAFRLRGKDSSGTVQEATVAW